MPRPGHMREPESVRSTGCGEEMPLTASGRRRGKRNRGRILSLCKVNRDRQSRPQRELQAMR